MDKSNVRMHVYSNRTFDDMVSCGVYRVVDSKYRPISFEGWDTLSCRPLAERAAIVITSEEVAAPVVPPPPPPVVIPPVAAAPVVPPPPPPVVIPPVAAAPVVPPPPPPVVIPPVVAAPVVPPPPPPVVIPPVAAAPVVPPPPPPVVVIPPVVAAPVVPPSPPPAEKTESLEEVLQSNIAEFINLDSAPAGSGETNPPPFINFTVFNRLGLAFRNLTNLLDSDEDFELNIIDGNSKDNSWDYILSLNDRRIKSKTRFRKNLGPIYSANYALSRRKPNQYFITVDSDTFIRTKNWISKYMEVFQAFPDVGLLGVMRDDPYPRYLPPITPRANGAVSYLELKNADIHAQMDFVPGHLQCLSPQLIEKIGFWSEENGFGDAELSPRVVHYTDLRAGFVTTVEIDMTQKIPCSECRAKEFCKLSRSVSDCFSLGKRLNKNISFVEKNQWKFEQTFAELQQGTRTVYCGSIFDPESTKSHLYYEDWAKENFGHYLQNSN